jgi:hypothetical protein
MAHPVDGRASDDLVVPVSGDGGTYGDDSSRRDRSTVTTCE